MTWVGRTNVAAHAITPKGGLAIWDRGNALVVGGIINRSMIDLCGHGWGSRDQMSGKLGCSAVLQLAAFPIAANNLSTTNTSPSPADVSADHCHPHVRASTDQPSARQTRLQCHSLASE